LVEWPEPVARVAAFAREAGAELRLEEFATGTPTARAAAEAVGCELGAIGKSIVFDCDGRVVVALIPGDRRADPEKVAAAVGAAAAKVHVGAHGLRYGTGVFEGIRCYETPKGPAVFRLADHMQRLHDSAKLLYMELPYSVEELRAATHELIDANGLPACYIR